MAMRAVIEPAMLHAFTKFGETVLYFAAGQVIKPKGLEAGRRSEEHTSELQSLMRISYAVFCLKKKNNKKMDIPQNQIVKLINKNKTKNNTTMDTDKRQ